jgi:hypothetical protein
MPEPLPPPPPLLPPPPALAPAPAALPAAAPPASPRSLTRPPGAMGGRVFVLLVGALATAFVIISTASSLAATLGREERVEPVSFPTGIRKVVAVDSGAVEIRGSDRTTVSGERRLTIGVERPNVSETVTGDTLRIETSCDWWGWGWCGAGYSLDVPRSVAVDVLSRAGRVSVTGVDGEVKASSYGGRVTAEGLGGPANLSSQAGGVTATGLSSGRVTADSSAGRVSLSFAEAPDWVEAHSAAGGVRIELPPGPVVYRVDASSSAGDTRVEVNNGPVADNFVKARSSAGSVEVVYLSG